MTSLIFIIPAASRAAGNATLAGIGWGPNALSAAIGVGGTVTHYAAHADRDDLPVFDSAALVNAVPGLSIQPSDSLTGRAHFDAVLADLGLAVIEATL